MVQYVQDGGSQASASQPAQHAYAAGGQNYYAAGWGAPKPALRPASAGVPGTAAAPGGWRWASTWGGDAQATGTSFGTQAAQQPGGLQAWARLVCLHNLTIFAE